MRSTGCASTAGGSEKINGYAEFKRGDTVMVDGQRVVAGKGTKVSGANTLLDIPIGYEVKVQGRRDPKGAVVAEKVQAKPNGTDGTEEQIIAASNQAEET